MEKKRRGEKDDSEDCPRKDMCPDRTMSDFYCNICDAHMNSEQMWESHISGKRHLKNIKKEPGEMPSKVKSIKVNISPKLMDVVTGVTDPLVGLGFMTELQRADPDLKPSYTCHLCQANCTWSVVIDHILSTKHRLAYLKAVDPEQHEVIENMELKKTSLDQLAEDRAREYERKRGCGTMQVKLEKPKVAPPPPKVEKAEKEDLPSPGCHSRSLSAENRQEYHPSFEELYYERRRERSRSPPKYRYHSPSYRRRKHVSPADGIWRHDRYSPDTTSPPPSRVGGRSVLSDIATMSVSEMQMVLKQYSRNVVLISDAEAKEAKNVINLCARNILKLKVQQLPEVQQNKLAKLIVKGDVNGLEHELRPFLENIFNSVRDTSPSSHRRHRHSSSTSRKRLH